MPAFPQPAETLALKALGYLAGSEGALERFLAESGADAADLRQAAMDPHFLSAVMDFLMSDDSLAAGFCEAEGLSAEDLHRARHRLPGA